MPEIISRRDAILKGATFFYTGKPCKHGHWDFRYTTTGGCKSCVNPKIRNPNTLNNEAPLSFHPPFYAKTSWKLSTERVDAARLRVQQLLPWIFAEMDGGPSIIRGPNLYEQTEVDPVDPCPEGRVPFDDSAIDPELEEILADAGIKTAYATAIQND